MQVLLAAWAAAQGRQAVAVPRPLLSGGVLLLPPPWRLEGNEEFQAGKRAAAAPLWDWKKR